MPGGNGGLPIMAASEGREQGLLEQAHLAEPTISVNSELD